MGLIMPLIHNMIGVQALKSFSKTVMHEKKSLSYLFQWSLCVRLVETGSTFVAMGHHLRLCHIAQLNTMQMHISGRTRTQLFSTIYLEIIEIDW